MQNRPAENFGVGGLQELHKFFTAISHLYEPF